MCSDGQNLVEMTLIIIRLSMTNSITDEDKSDEFQDFYSESNQSAWTERMDGTDCEVQAFLLINRQGLTGNWDKINLTEDLIGQ